MCTKLTSQTTVNLPSWQRSQRTSNIRPHALLTFSPSVLWFYSEFIWVTEL
jgi:hypothetical protein